MWILRCLRFVGLTVAFYAEQNKELKSLEATIPWETRMMQGGIYEHLRLTMLQLRKSSEFNVCGVESNWEL